jgi:raffinose/stachyose/melibiose transport system permease protein
VTIYQLLTVWNGFILPLILTQSGDKQTLPLAPTSWPSWASVTLTTLPILDIYVIGRRQLFSGLTVGFGKWPTGGTVHPNPPTPPIP